MSSKKPNNIFIFIIIILAIVGFGYYLTKSSANKTQTSPTKTAETLTNQGGADNKTSELLMSGSLIYASRNEKTFNIYKYDTKEKKSKVIFTDKDEESKIKYADSLTYDGKILAFLVKPQEEFIGDLYLISSDGSGSKTKLVENFASTSNAFISPDAKKIAYVQFSNAEADYGFKLIIANSDNSSKSEALRDQTNLVIYSWSEDNKNIIFTKGMSDSKTTIYSYNLATSETKEIDDATGKVNSADWQDNMMVYGDSQDKEASSQIYFFKDNSSKKIFSDQKYSLYPHFSKNSLIAFASIEKTENSAAIYQDGKIKVMDLFGNNLIEIANGNLIIGWME